MCEFKDELLKMAKECGADLMGVAPAARFGDGHKIFRIFPGVKSVVGFAFRNLRGSYRGVEEGTTYYQYTTMSVENTEETVMPVALVRLANLIESHGFTAVPQRRHQTIMEESDSTNPEVGYEAITRGRTEETQFDFIDAAVRCGLGDKGFHGALLTDDFGPMQRLCFILTDADLPPDPVAAPHLCDRCGKCAAACPGKCVAEDGSVDQWRCAVYYNGANGTKNPFMPPDAYADFEDRLAIIAGEAQVTPEKARKIMDATYFYPPAQHAYTCSICARACDVACYCHLEERGALKRKFKRPFRSRPEWKFSLADFKALVVGFAMLTLAAFGDEVVVMRKGVAETNRVSAVGGVLRLGADRIGAADWVDVTPDFARARKGEDGYFVLPSGHLGTFRESDGEFSVPTDLMPLWCFKTTNGMNAALVEGMPWDCKTFVRSARGAYSLSMRFDLGGRRPEEDIAIRYQTFPAGAEYPQVAAWYREERLRRGEIVPLRDRAASRPELAYAVEAVEIRIRQAWKPAPSPVKEQTPSNEPPMKAVVTFDRVAEFARALKAAGVGKAEICLVGWNRKGHDGRYPQIFPVEPELGGEDALRRLIAEVQSLGYRIVCHNNHSDAYSVADCWSPGDIIREPNGSLSKNACWSGGQMYNLCPRVAWEKYAQKDLAAIAALGFRGLHYIDVLSIVAPRRCFAASHPLTRREGAEYVNRMLSYGADRMGGIASEGGFDFTAGHLDYALYISFADPSAEMPKMTDRFVPFWQLVYHGIVMSNPFAHTVNYTIKDRRTRMIAAEFGSRPAFYLHSNFLANRAWMGKNDLTLDTPEHLAAAVDAVKAGAEDYAGRSHLQTCFMTDHRVIPDGRGVQIGYSDGTKMLVGAEKWELVK